MALHRFFRPCFRISRFRVGFGSLYIMLLMYKTKLSDSCKSSLKSQPRYFSIRVIAMLTSFPSSDRPDLEPLLIFCINSDELRFFWIRVRTFSPNSSPRLIAGMKVCKVNLAFIQQNLECPVPHTFSLIECRHLLLFPEGSTAVWSASWVFCWCRTVCLVLCMSFRPGGTSLARRWFVQHGVSA